MGKPSSHNVVSKPSSNTLSSKPSSRMNISMSSSKKSKKKIRKYRKMQNNIKKLFTELRHSSTLEISDVDNTVIDLEKKTCTNISNKHKLEESNSTSHVKKRSKTDSSLIIVNNEPDVINIKSVEANTCLTPKKSSNVQCSTPINKYDNKTNNDTLSIENFNTDISNLTKEINDDSYVTIDLTNETLNCSSRVNPVIDLDNTVDSDCTVVSVSNASTMSNDSEVTVLYMPQKKVPAKKDIEKVVQGLNHLNASKKGKMLEYIVKTLLNGCEVSENLKNVAKNIGIKESTSKGTTTAEDTYIKEMIIGQTTSRNSIGSNIYNPERDLRNKTGLRMVVIDGSNVAMDISPQESTSKGTTTAEDTYIKEMIIGQTTSRNSIGSNIYNPERDLRNKTGLRMVVIDGSNVAMEHGKGKVFSVKGLKICIDYFLKRGHGVKAFVPRFRCKYGKSTEPRLLDELERRGLVVYTPSREINGKFVTSYDDRYIVQCAAEFNAVIVSGDNYRDLLKENPRWRTVIENRLLPFTWVEDMIMFPRDPLGRHGPTLEKFLRHSETVLRID